MLLFAFTMQQTPPRHNRPRPLAQQGSVPSEHEEKLIHSDGDRALVQATQRDWRASFLGNLQKLLRYNPKQVAWVTLANRAVGPSSAQSSLLTSATPFRAPLALALTPQCPPAPRAGLLVVLHLTQRTQKWSRSSFPCATKGTRPRARPGQGRPRELRPHASAGSDSTPLPTELRTQPRCTDLAQPRRSLLAALPAMAARPSPAPGLLGRRAAATGLPGAPSPA